MNRRVNTGAWWRTLRWCKKNHLQLNITKTKGWWWISDGAKGRDTGRMDRLVRKASSVVGVEMEILMSVVEKRILSKLMSIMDNERHPLHITLITRKTVFSGRLLLLACSTDRLRGSFVPRAIHATHVIDWRA